MRSLLFLLSVLIISETPILAMSKSFGLALRANKEILTEDTRNYASNASSSLTPSAEHTSFDAPGYSARCAVTLNFENGPKGYYAIGAAVDGLQVTHATKETTSMKTILSTTRYDAGLLLSTIGTLSGNLNLGFEGFVGSLVSGSGKYSTTYDVDGLDAESETVSLSKGRTYAVSVLLLYKITAMTRFGINLGYRWNAATLVKTSTKTEALYALSGPMAGVALSF